jgi:outer membrane protein assembly factor BamB
MGIPSSSQKQFSKTMAAPESACYHECRGATAEEKIMQRRFCLPSLLLVAALATKAGHAQIKTYGAAAKPDRAANVAWRMDGNGHFPGVRPLVDWSADRNMLWKTRVEVGGYSSPIVVGNKVFVTAEMGSLICLDLADGKILWKKDLFSKDSQDIPADLSKKLMRGCGGESKHSTPTPASNGQLVFYVNAMGLCACYDLEGNLKWIRIVETAEDEEHFCASPLFHGDRIIQSWGCLLALSAKDGKTLWKAADAKPTYATPVVAKANATPVVVTPAGDIVRLADGEVLCSGLFESAYTTPLVEGNVLYVIDGKAVALELPAKAEKGLRPKELWKTDLNGVFMASPVYRDGLIYTIEKRCRLHVIDAKTGKVLTVSRALDEATKTEQLTSGVKIEGLAPAHYAYASPTVTDRNVFFFDDAGNAAVFELGPACKPVRVNKIEDGFTGTPFFVQDKIIIRGTKTIYCIGAKN